MSLSLFQGPLNLVTTLPGGRVEHLQNWLKDVDGIGDYSTLRQRLTSEAWWNRPPKTPRSLAYQSPFRYGYSGNAHNPEPFSQSMRPILVAVSYAAKVQFNSVLLNRYMDGNDSVAWHADDEPELGDNPTIASVSLGATRRFVMKPKSKANYNDKATTDVDISLADGDLLIMNGCQKDWLHSIPKTSRPVGERLNLTFRKIVT